MAFRGQPQVLGANKLPANRNDRLLVLLGAAALSLAVVFILPPIGQDQGYHQFADQRALLATPNFWNVVSNIPFVLVGAAGLCLRASASIRVIFLGIFLAGLGSAYYHWNPGDAALFWDRLPMALAFMAILANAIEERVNVKAGAILLWPLLALGIVSLVIWRATGDLRLYGWVQFFPCLALPLLFWLYPPKYTGTANWLVAGALYLLAKVFEYLDVPIYSAGHILSGHTLKHLAAAAACFVTLRNFQTRRPVSAATRS
jgi:hypothetical protein